MTFAVISKSISILIQNWRQILRMFLLPAIIALIPMTVLVLSNDPVQTTPSAGGALLTLFTALAAWFIFLWCVVAWHRYVLLGEETDSLFPNFHGDRMLGYFGYGLLIGVILIIPMLILIAIAMPLLRGTNVETGFAPRLVMFSFGVVVTYLVLRLSMVLPASALGAETSVGNSWKQTSPYNSDFWGIAFVIAIAQGVAEFVAAQFAGSGVLVLIGQLPMLLLSALYVSILTTLYGHIVEKREL